MARKKKRKSVSLQAVNKKLLFFKGGAGLTALILVAIVMGVVFVMAPKKSLQPPEQTVQNTCLDYDPPNQSESVEFNGEQFDLIKKYAGIVESKMNEMEKVGSYNGADIYKLKSTNYFGEAKNDDIIYVLREIKEGYYYFDIYIRRGVPIPDNIKNGKSIGGGGTITIIIDDDETFPPRGFNSSKVINPTVTLSYPTYLFSSNQTTLSAITTLGAKNIGTLSTPKGNLPLYFHLDSLYLIDSQAAYEYVPSNENIDFDKFLKEARKSLQLKKLTIKTIQVNPTCWFTPSCKPALYLYPKKETDVNVQVVPKGYFTYTDPKYDNSKGWNVTAYPDGTIEHESKQYPYLYYETKINNSELTIPDKGYVAKYEELEKLFDEVLFKLGLSEKETQDFKEYWLDVLPYSRYYFVGIVDIETINHVEKLSISPAPDQIIRVRLYFEALNEYKKVKEPEISQIKRDSNGFLATEWGGLVKVDSDTQFTCSQ